MVTNVLLILGSLRSGSTVFEQYLARAANAEAMGEVVNVLDSGFVATSTCTCGQPFPSCPRWSEIMTAVEQRVGGREEFQRIAQDLEADLWRLRSLLTLHHPLSRSDSFSRRHRDELRLLGILYEEIEAKTGAQLIIDSSKLARYGHLLSTLDNVRVAYVVLIRDSRAVVNSWQRVKTDPKGGGLRPIPYRSAIRQWISENLLDAALLPYEGSRMIAVTYEEFVRSPELTLDRVNALLTRLGMPVLGEPDPDTLVGRYHSFSGNPARFDLGAPLVEDLGWRSEMTWLARLGVTVVTAPVLAAHHLLLWRHSRERRA